MQKISRTLNFLFAKIIASHSQTHVVVIKPSAYVIKNGFYFSLDVFVNASLILKPDQLFNYAKLKERFTLDKAQRFAVIQILSNKPILIRGLSGTEKSYTNVIIIKTLFRNRNAADLDFIICVYYTNHALDQMLKHLMKKNKMQIICLNLRSKFNLLENLNLCHIARKFVFTKTKKHDKWKHNQNIEKTLRELKDILFELNNLSF